MIFVLAWMSLRISDCICAIKARALGHALRAMRSHNNYLNVRMSGDMSGLFGGNAPTFMEKRMVNAMGDDECCRLEVRKLAFLLLPADGGMNCESTEFIYIEL